MSQAGATICEKLCLFGHSAAGAGESGTIHSGCLLIGAEASAIAAVAICVGNCVMQGYQMH